MIRLLSILLCATLFAACTKDNPVSPTPLDGSRGVFIVNEGNFQRGNASLSLFVPASDTVYNDVFRSVNARDLGDTGNSITVHSGRAYIVVNGSNRIEVIDVAGCKSVKTITCPAGASPRAIAFDAQGTGYITNLYANTVSVYDDAANTITASIPVGMNPEQLLVANGCVFVTNSGFGADRTVSVISTATHAVVKTLTVADSPAAIAQVDANTAVVLCGGAYNDFSDPNDDTPGKLFWINTATQTVTDSLTLGGHPQRIALDGAGHLFTVHETGITRVDLAARSISAPFIAGAFYGLAYDRTRALLYATEALDYVQRGNLVVYDAAGAKLRSFQAGIIPGAIAIVE